MVFRSPKTKFHDLPVYNYKPAEPLRDPKLFAPRIWAWDYDDDDNPTGADHLASMLNDPKADEITALLFGPWGYEMWDSPPERELETLVAGAKKLPKLSALFWGDVEPPQADLSYMLQTDISALWEAFPTLQKLVVRGGTDLKLGKIQHHHLTSLRLETSGLPKEVLAELAQSQLPVLENLELFLGEQHYGWNGTVDDVIPVFDSGKFPMVTKLGLQNSEIVNDLIPGLVESSLFPQLKEIDLSFGTLGDEGAEILVSADLSHLDKITARHHFMSDDMVRYFANEMNAKFGGKCEFDFSDKIYKETYRYIAVGE